METTEISNTCHYKCTGCGADLTYAPGTTQLQCQYCGTQQQIASVSGDTIVNENDYLQYLSEKTIDSSEKQTVHTVNCKSCGATVTLDSHITSDKCIFCGTPLVVADSQTGEILKPEYLLPFKITHQNAHDQFKKWLGKLWFAPNKLKHYGDNADMLSGVYIPYWTYDSNTATNYTGQRGTNHTESYTVTVNGKSERRTRTVIRWQSVSGHVSHFFDDVLILASNSLPRNVADKLDPWDLENLTDYDEQYLSGFRTESYQVKVEDGFGIAKSVMNRTIESLIRRDIGGDHQQITSYSTNYSNVTFKHILLPIWISAYRYKGKTYRFLINGRTGEVQGERPWSWIKITLASLAAAALGTGGYFLYVYLNNGGM
jgi:predicted RNA-binding Zn-ribbon protein involved in translation (DUF1610 family)